MNRMTPLVLGLGLRRHFSWSVTHIEYTALHKEEGSIQFQDSTFQLQRSLQAALSDWSIPVDSADPQIAAIP
jgi:hypothetical protein